MKESLSAVIYIQVFRKNYPATLTLLDCKIPSLDFFGGEGRGSDQFCWTNCMVTIRSDKLLNAWSDMLHQISV